MTRARDHDPARTTKMHAHRYVFPLANGPKVVGVCACGASQERWTAGDPAFDKARAFADQRPATGGHTRWL